MLEIEGMTVGYGKDTVIEDLDWVVGGHDSLITALLGPSGCGKSTLIRAIAGLETPTAGRIRFNDTDLARLPTHRRDFGVVFQDGQLFPGRTVAANVAYGLRVRGFSRAEAAARVGEMLELVELPGVEKRRVEALSGGQAQRVALARALAPRPRLLLLDEPLAALDRRLRETLAIEIAEIICAAGTPTIVVTHDHGEAALMADSIAVMRDGAIIQAARPAALWSAPTDEWTARFLGCTSVIEARRSGEGLADTELGSVAVRLPGPTAQLGLRAESVLAIPLDKCPLDDTPADRAVGTVVVVSELPTGPRVRVATDRGEFDAVAAAPTAVGARVALTLVAERIAVVEH